jgi:hypothetical protein
VLTGQTWLQRLDRFVEVRRTHEGSPIAMAERKRKTKGTERAAKKTTATAAEGFTAEERAATCPGVEDGRAARCGCGQGRR